MIRRNEQRRIVAYLDGLQAKVNGLRELQSTSGDELCPYFGWTLTSYPCGMVSVLDRAFKSELI